MWQEDRERKERIAKLQADPKRVDIKRAIKEFDLLTKYDSRMTAEQAFDLEQLKQYAETEDVSKCVEFLNQHKVTFAKH